MRYSCINYSEQSTDRGYLVVNTTQRDCSEIVVVEMKCREIGCQLMCEAVNRCRVAPCAVVVLSHEELSWEMDNTLFLFSE